MTILIKRCLFLLFGFSLILASCSPQTSASPAENQHNETPTSMEVKEEIPTQIVEEVTPTTQTPSLSQQVYSSPSNAFSIPLPQAWNCSETGLYRVDCHNADDSASFVMRVIATGYELLQEDFISLVTAEMVSTYENVRAYSEITREISEGSALVESTWKEAEETWQGVDRFVRSGAAVYHLRINTAQLLFEDYRPLFEEMTQKAALNSLAMSGAPLYSYRKEYISREMIFNIQVPTSWSRYVDVASIERTVVEGFISPDKHASVQVAIYSKGSPVSQEIKASKTLEIMRKFYGWDLRVSHDKALTDGRERLEWHAERRGINGVSFFDSAGTFIYIFSIIWDDATKAMYKPVLDEISESFKYQ